MLQILIDFDFSVSHQIVANSLTPARKRRRTEASNVEPDELAAGPSLPKRVSGVEQTLPISDNFSSPTLNVGDIRLAKMLMEKSKRIGNLEGTDFYAVPLKKSSTKIGPSTLNRFIFDLRAVGPSLQMDQVKKNKTILLVGAPDSGRTSLMDSLFNFIVGVDWNDPFRFLLKEDGQEETQTISVYEIRHADGFRIPFSLTVVELPVCVDTPPHDVSEMLGNFFQSGAIQQLDLIGLVSPANSAPSPSCESFLSLLGKDLKENLNCLWTFADVKEEPSQSSAFVESLPFHDFHNLEFISANGHCDPYSRAIYWKSFQDFFCCLANSTPNRLSQTKKVLEERKQLEVTFGKLRKLVEKGTALREEIVESKKMIADCQAQIEGNMDVIKTTRKTELWDGVVAANCKKCGVTCSLHCSGSLVIDTPFCSVCPMKCDWGVHSIHVPYVLGTYVQNVPRNSEDVKKLEKHLGNLEKLVAEERVNSMEQKVLRFQVIVCIEELDQIALRPFLMSPEFCDVMA